MEFMVRFGWLGLDLVEDPILADASYKEMSPLRVLLRLTKLMDRLLRIASRS